MSKKTNHNSENKQVFSKLQEHLPIWLDLIISPKIPKSSIKFWASCVILFAFDSPWKQTTEWKLEKWIPCARQALFFAEKRITKTKDNLEKYYWEIAQSILMMRSWLNEFRWICTRTRNAKCSGRPIGVTLPGTIENIYDKLQANERL